ncbi:hypothetical protein C4375_03520 [Devosia sp. I507]|nr:hypothetical protein C4375_03520 [Devosia sp. I507]
MLKWFLHVDCFPHGLAPTAKRATTKAIFGRPNGGPDIDQWPDHDGEAMSIVVKLEFVFDTADEVVELVDQLLSPMAEGEMLRTQPQSTYQARVERTDAQAQQRVELVTDRRQLQPVPVAISTS